MVPPPTLCDMETSGVDSRLEPLPPSLTSDVRPQVLVVFLQKVVQHDGGVLLMRPGYQHLIDCGVMVILVIAIIQQITSGGGGGRNRG